MRSLGSLVLSGLAVTASAAGLWFLSDKVLAQDKPTFKAKVDLVVLSFTVEDGRGRYINGLKPSDFKILEDGINQKISTFAEGNKPPMQVMADGTLKPMVNPDAGDPSKPGSDIRTDSLIGTNVFLLFDTSNFMYRGFVYAEDAIADFIRGVDKADSVAVYTFSRNLSRASNLSHNRNDAIFGLRKAVAGDPCPRCPGGTLTSYRGIEAGHIFVLGTKYSHVMGATYIDEKQQIRDLVMGCYGIGVSRLVATTIEQHNDANGMIWPMSVAPYHVHLVTIGRDENLLAVARDLYRGLQAANVEVLWDDRDERPGVKFKDADLIGIPLRVTIGAKGLAEGRIELKARTETDPKKAELLLLADAAAQIAGRVKAGLAAS